MIRKIIAVDLLPMERRAKEFGFPYIPLKELHDMCAEGDVDVIETLVTLPERQPENDTPEAVAKAHVQHVNKRNALQLSGARVIECPSKRSQSTPSGFKQSDDQRLMLTTLILARAMPAATNSTILCYRCGRDGSLASGCVFLSTLLSLVTIPLVLTMLFAA